MPTNRRPPWLRKFKVTPFLITTAREELAKAYILADICRLDPEVHGSVIAKLCKAFYSHIAKYAYLDIYEFSKCFGSMSDIVPVWDIGIRKWWPASDSLEPCMPHDVYLLREKPIYVDYSEWDQDWLIPSNAQEAILFENRMWKAPDAEHHLSGWRIAMDLNLCSSDAFAAVRACFSNRYIGKSAKWSDVNAIYERFVAELGLQKSLFATTSLRVWPLYYLVVDRGF